VDEFAEDGNVKLYYAVFPNGIRHVKHVEMDAELAKLTFYYHGEGKALRALTPDGLCWKRSKLRKFQRDARRYSKNILERNVSILFPM